MESTFNIFSIISLVLNLVLSGGFILTLVTVKSLKKEAAAKAKVVEQEAKKGEIDNVESAVKIWREIAENINKQYDDVSRELEVLREEVKKLRATNNKIIKMLDKITTENFENIIEQIKQEIN
jgi:septal ring factor EnvC (AmiA/AmiB activator)